MLVPFPVAFWTGAVFTDIVGGLSGDAFWFRMSFELIGMGNLGGAAAALCGFIDYRTVALSPRANRIALAHLIGSLLSLVVFVLAFALRLGAYAAPAGIAATAFGTLVLLGAGYYGSELANRYGVGFLDAPRHDAQL
jgi:uncharacterized membrane protein